MSDMRVWKIVPLRMVTTSEQERDKWIAAGREVVEFVSIDRIKELEDQLAAAKKDQARYQYAIDWLEGRVRGSKEFLRAKTKEQYEQAIDAAIASIQDKP